MEEQVYEKFFGGLNPEEYWQFPLQEDLARHSIKYYIMFNNLGVMDIEDIYTPYVFTKQRVYEELKLLLQSTYGLKNFEISPDSNGGLESVYLGDVNIILTVDMDKDLNVVVESILGGIITTMKLSHEISMDTKIKNIKRFLKL